MTTERESKAADQQASYAARGREFEKLSGDDLTARWRLAFAAVADQPLEPTTEGLEADLASEFALRGIERPWHRVRGALERFMRNRKV
jgi:hypothetical protein